MVRFTTVPGAPATAATPRSLAVPTSPVNGSSPSIGSPSSCSPCAKVHCPGALLQLPACQNLQMVRRTDSSPGRLGTGASLHPACTTAPTDSCCCCIAALRVWLHGIIPGTVPTSCSPCANVHCPGASLQIPACQNLQILRRTMDSDTRAPGIVPISCSPCAKVHCPGASLQIPACQNLQILRRTVGSGTGAPSIVPISCSPCAKVHWPGASRQVPTSQNLQTVRRTAGASLRKAAWGILAAIASTGSRIWGLLVSARIGMPISCSP
mmetsp:Transcript_102450/g.265380  ORF Transcript_102450/g.265380 Transcript_102450/m.265380 type:complete len:267 (-) Transcript_102450:678-1478(-)